jgi:hypothetical protein
MGLMGLPRPPGLATIKSWFLRTVNNRISKVDTPAQQPSQHPSPSTGSRAYSSLTKSSTHRLHSQTIKHLHIHPQTRTFHQFYIPRHTRPSPPFPRIKFHPSTSLLRPQIGAFPKNPWSGISRFHTSPASSAIVLNQITHSVSTALRNGLHPKTKLQPPITGQIIAQVAARAACQTKDGPAGYIRFTLSPPAWTPTDTDLSDPDIVNAIDTHIAELQRIKTAIQKLKQYGDFPVRAVVLSNSEATMDVLFRGATAEDVRRWNQNEFRLASGRVGADTVFCAGRFEEFVKWSEVLDAEKKAEREMAVKANGGLLKFWEELNILERRPMFE